MQSAVPTACKPSSVARCAPPSPPGKAWMQRAIRESPLRNQKRLSAKKERGRSFSLCSASFRRRMRQGRGGRQTAPYDLCAAFAHFGRGRRLDDPLHRRKSGRPMAAPAKSEATVGEKREKPRLLSLLCAFFTPHHFARYSAAAIRVKITHASERTISSFGR